MKNITKKWLEFAEKDLKVANDLLEKKHWQYCALFCHQAIEKILKAYIIEKGKTPRKIHDLTSLLVDAGIKVSERIISIVETLNPHYMPPRYPDIAYKIKLIYTEEIAWNLLKSTQEIFKWLKDKLHEK
ncbi:MAG: HEPN domain-containing protein [Elusimicrobiota bacterium]